MSLKKIRNIFTPEYFILLLSVWQFFSVLFMAIGIWPSWVVWINLGLLFVFFILAETAHSVVLTIISIPFFVAMPLEKLSSLQMWRVVFAFLFAVWAVRDLKFFSRPLTFWKKIKFFYWDKFLLLFAAVCLASLLWARFPVAGLKQVIFWFNIYIFYLVLGNTLETRRQAVRVMKAGAISLGLIVLLGYVQLAVTFLTNLDVFWVYWASFVSRLYYGAGLSDVLLYSNSWFSYLSGSTELRMFSIMPDSHSFALMGVYCISFLIPLTYHFLKAPPVEKEPRKITIFNKKIKIFGQDNKALGLTVNYYLWLAIRFAGLAIILSGTRAVWVGLLAPLFILIICYYTNYLKLLARKTLWPYLIIILFFIVSPFINQGLNYLRVSGYKENFLERAQSIYDLKEQSNVGRIEIWKASVMYSLRHPWGTGLNNYLVSLHSGDAGGLTYDQLANEHNEEFNLPNKFVTAHSLFLHLLVEVGFVGVAAFLLFWGMYFYKVEKFIKSRKKHNDIYIFFLFEAALTFVWLLASGMFDVTLFNDKVLIYFFISLGLSGIIMENYNQWLEEPKNHG